MKVCLVQLSFLLFCGSCGAMLAQDISEQAAQPAQDPVFEKAQQNWKHLPNLKFTTQAVQPDEKILVLGSFDSPRNGRLVAVGRLLPDLQPDALFGMGGLLLIRKIEDNNLIPDYIGVLDDGKIGVYIKTKGRLALIKVLPSGDVDELSQVTYTPLKTVRFLD